MKSSAPSPSPTQVVVFIRGGVVQSAVSNVAGVEVSVFDYDCQGTPAVAVDKSGEDVDVTSHVAELDLEAVAHAELAIHMQHECHDLPWSLIESAVLNKAGRRNGLEEKLRSIADDIDLSAISLSEVEEAFSSEMPSSLFENLMGQFRALIQERWTAARQAAPAVVAPNHSPGSMPSPDM